MADEASGNIPSLAKDWSLPVQEAAPVAETKTEVPAETTEEQMPGDETPEEVAPEKVEEAPAVEEPPSAVEESTETPQPEESADTGATEEVNGAVEEESAVVEAEEGKEEKPKITQLQTAPADFRFPTTNQTRHCFTRYIEYHRCIAAKGEDAPECDKFARYYRSLCPSEWVERWNEQRENGTFPGPL